MPEAQQTRTSNMISLSHNTSSNHHNHQSSRQQKMLTNSVVAQSTIMLNQAQQQQAPNIVNYNTSNKQQIGKPDIYGKL